MLTESRTELDPATAERELPPGPPSRGRRFAVRFLMVMFSTGLTLAACEAVLWIVAPVPYDEWLIWEPEGHYRARPVPGQVVKNSSGHEVRINKYGFRGPDWGFQKQPGTLRIAVYGGSAGFCYHAAGEEKTWPGALEIKLERGLNMPVEVINLSLPGFDSFNNKFSYLCFGRAFDPDAIIVYHTWNDMKNFRSIPVEPYRRTTWVPNKPLWQRIARATQIGRRARNFVWTMTKRRMDNTQRKIEGTGVGLDSPVDEKAFAWERQNFVDFSLLAQHDGALPILVTQACLATLENLDDPDVRLAVAPLPKTVAMSQQVIVQTWQRVSQIIKEVAEEYNAIFVDGYNAVPHDLIHLRDEVHLHDEGSEALATEIARVLLADARFLQLVDQVKNETTIAPAAGSP